MNIEDLDEQALINGQEQAKSVLTKRKESLVEFHIERTAGVLVAEGDSWFDYPGRDILNALEDQHRFEVEMVANAGDTIEDMAYNDGQLEDFVRKIERVLRRGQVPKAILLSAGGNDIVGDGFKDFLNHARSPNPGLNDQVVAEFVDVRIRAAYIHIIAAINEVCVDNTGAIVPIITHGYDYSVPDGRGKLWFGPWLEPGFRVKGYLDLAENKTIVIELINRFHQMMVSLKEVQGLEHVSHIDLRGTLPTDTESYKEWWDNELHPERKGFEKIGTIFAKKIAIL
ncbi:MAG: hypothetical protein AB2777_16110 [Candidatus Thiodiazotropha endolucinida]